MTLPYARSTLRPQSCLARPALALGDVPLLLELGRTLLGSLLLVDHVDQPAVKLGTTGALSATRVTCALAPAARSAVSRCSVLPGAAAGVSDVIRPARTDAAAVPSAGGTPEIVWKESTCARYRSPPPGAPADGMPALACGGGIPPLGGNDKSRLPFDPSSVLLRNLAFRVRL